MTPADRRRASVAPHPVAGSPAFAPDVRLLTFALAAASQAVSGLDRLTESVEAQYLLSQPERVASTSAQWPANLQAYLQRPSAADVPLLQLAQTIGLSTVETLTVALCCGIEEDPMAGRALAYVQAPVGGARPTLGLLTSVLSNGTDTGVRTLQALATGAAVKSGLLGFTDERPPLPERALAIPVPLYLALSGMAAQWPGAAAGLDERDEVPLPASLTEAADRQAAALEGSTRALVIRSASQLEARCLAARIARSLHHEPLFIEKEHISGLGLFLNLRRFVPVFVCEPSPGERRTLPHIPHYQGPVLAIGGPDGAIETASGAALVWSVTVPSKEERRSLWQAGLGSDELATELSQHHRHGAGRIAQLSRLTRHQLALRGGEVPSRQDVFDASWSSEGSGLDALAEPLHQPIPDEALVLPHATRAELDLLLLRCRLRDGLDAGLGASIRARFRTGVRALLVGPSGTGKTLVAGWLSTRLGIPLYRVDLSAVMSKYIGETEKNLAQLLSRAEQAEIILLFDEADALFGKRTDVKEANDRFANAQTNYLLQRIETFDGITLLTSNSRGRFDAAFTRRLDAIIDFPLPGPEERRAIWLSHLGDGHELSQREVNQLAAAADVGGGHIRNVVVTAAVLAQGQSRRIGYSDLVEGLAVEYRKLGRQLSADLRQPDRDLAGGA